jgi:cbb3-type cytochrome oxidase subunit 3
MEKGLLHLGCLGAVIMASIVTCGGLIYSGLPLVEWQLSIWAPEYVQMAPKIYTVSLFTMFFLTILFLLRRMRRVRREREEALPPQETVD